MEHGFSLRWRQQQTDNYRLHNLSKAGTFVRTKPRMVLLEEQLSTKTPQILQNFPNFGPIVAGLQKRNSRRGLRNAQKEEA